MGGCGAPPQLRPPGELPHAKPAVKSLAAKEPAAGGAPPAPHGRRMVLIEVGRLKSPTALLATSEYSPALAKRNEVPHPPLMVAPSSSDNCQVKPTFGLLVPPASVPRY